MRPVWTAKKIPPLVREDPDPVGLHKKCRPPRIRTFQAPSATKRKTTPVTNPEPRKMTLFKCTQLRGTRHTTTEKYLPPLSLPAIYSKGDSTQTTRNLRHKIGSPVFHGLHIAKKDLGCSLFCDWGCRGKKTPWGDRKNENKGKE